MQVKFQKLHKDAQVPQYHSAEAAGFDLAICEDVSVSPFGTALAPTGLVIQAPVGHFLLIVPRSSTAKRYNLTLGNTVGIVDRDYCGPRDELFLQLRSTSQFAVDVPKGTRLAQGLFIPVTQADFIDQSEPIAVNRGGWGSTGR